MVASHMQLHLNGQHCKALRINAQCLFLPPTAASGAVWWISGYQKWSIFIGLLFLLLVVLSLHLDNVVMLIEFSIAADS